MSTITAIYDIQKCGYCDGWHSGMCSRIKSIEYNEDGTFRRVELHPVPAIQEWSYVPPKIPAHICNCIGCCPRCGSCITNPGHTMELCDMLVRHKAEREGLYEQRTR